MEARSIDTRQWMRLGGLAGLLYLVADIVSNSIEPSSPNLNASISEITSYATDHRHTLIAGEIISIVAFVFALYWLGTIRHAFAQLGEERDPLAWIAVISGLGAATLALVSHVGTVLLTMLAGQSQGLANASVVRAVFDFSSINPSFILFAAFVPALGLAAVRRGLFGPWFGPWFGRFAVLDGVIAALAGAASLAIGSGSAWDILFFIGLIGFGLVVLILSVQMLRGQGVLATAE